VTKPLRLALYFGAGLAGLVLLLVLVALLVLPSRWFENQVRLTIVNEIERASGGRAEIGTFHFDWKALTARVSPFVLHGTEPPQEAPLLRAASVEVGLRVISIFHRDIHISSLHVDGPEINVLVDKNGITNFPTPKISRTSVTDPVQQVLDLSVRDFQIKGGSVRYIDRKIPIELEGRNPQVRTAAPRYGRDEPSHRCI
jgi:translocation and assembly module TamB